MFLFVLVSALEAPTKVVMKFGGSSLATAERVEHIASLIASQDVMPAVVVSAMGKTTNSIVGAGEKALDGEVDVNAIRQLHCETLDALELPAATGMEVRALLRDLEKMLDGVAMVQELSPRTKDLIVSFGERMSCRILAAQLNKLGVPAVPCDAWTLGLRTVGDFGEAVVDEACYEAVARNLEDLMDKQRVIPIVTGFVGHDHKGRVTTLGRGGSDLTATVLGSCNPGYFREIQVWKDVDGMMSADPRVVETAVPVPSVTYEEAAEMAYFGAQVLHPISMQPALKAQIPVRVKNSYNPSHQGTLISKDKTANCLVTAITSKRRITLVDVVSSRSLGAHGFLAKVFGVFDHDKVSVDMIATSEVSVSLTLDKKQMLSDDGLAALQDIAQVEIKKDRAIISVIADVARSTVLIASIFSTLHDHDIPVEMISQGASKVNIAIVVQDQHAERAVNLLHDCFFVGTACREEAELLLTR